MATYTFRVLRTGSPANGHQIRLQGVDGAVAGKQLVVKMELDKNDNETEQGKVMTSGCPNQIKIDAAVSVREDDDGIFMLVST